MAPFNFNSETHFVASSDGFTLQVYELTMDPTIHPSSIRKTHWKEVATIHPDLEDVVVAAIKEEEDDDQLYDGLLFIDDRGRIEGHHALTMLAQDLTQLGFLVRPEGYCFHDVREHEMFVGMDIHYLRLNDLFGWSIHGVEPVTKSSSMMWSNRFELKHFDRDFPEGGEELMMSWPRMTPYVTVRRDEYEELKQKVTDQDRKMEDMKDEIVEKNRELQKTIREKNREMRVLTYAHEEEVEKLKEEKDDVIVAKDKLLKKKDKEITKKDEEIEKLNDEKDDAIAAKDKLQKEKEEAIKKKDKELQRLKEEKDDANAATGKLQKVKDEEMKKKDEEIQRLKESTTKSKDENLEFQKKLAKKDDEIRRIEKEKSDEEAKTKKVESELKEARENLNKKGKECQSQSWTIPLSTRYLAPRLSETEKYRSLRQQVPPSTFSLLAQLGSGFINNAQKVVDGILVGRECDVKIIDEEISSATTKWPPLRTLYVYVGEGTTKDFDKNNWWYLKTTHPEGGLTMLVYYEGKHSQISLHQGTYVPLPYSKDAEVYSFSSKFSLFDLYPFGVRLGFAYREDWW